MYRVVDIDIRRKLLFCPHCSKWQHFCGRGHYIVNCKGCGHKYRTTECIDECKKFPVGYCHINGRRGYIYRFIKDNANSTIDEIYEGVHIAKSSIRNLCTAMTSEGILKRTYRIDFNGKDVYQYEVVE